MAYNKDVRISEKLILTQQEAAAYAGIGIHRLEAMIRNNPQDIHTVVYELKRVCNLLRFRR